MRTIKTQKLAVVGMGYVGLPLALAFDKVPGLDVIGFDIDTQKIEQYLLGIDPSDEVEPEAMRGCHVEFTYDASRLHGADIFIVAVPTPVNADETPNLTPLIEASKTVGRRIARGGLVIYESTVYPGVTETVCLPVLEEVSGMKCGVDFKVGYSPERINPGDKVRTLTNTVKVVSAMDEESLGRAASLYEKIITAGVCRAGSIMVAEAAKVVENCQRDLNIAFVNELAMIFDGLGIDTLEVLETAGTKWNFLPFRPGLVGGHCISVDPYYLIYDANKRGYHSSLLARGRHINNDIVNFLSGRVVKLLVQHCSAPREANVYILGAAFKENCRDLRNSKVYDIFSNLSAYGIRPKVADPVADNAEMASLYGDGIVPLAQVKDADCVIFATAHSEFVKFSKDDIARMFRTDGSPKIIIDVKGMYDAKELAASGYHYWRL